MPKRYRKLRGDTAYYPFAARTGLRACPWAFWPSLLWAW